MASMATTCPTDTCGSKNWASDAAITMSASATQWNAPPRAEAVDRGDHRLPHLLVPRGEVEVPVLDRVAVALHALAVGGDLGDVDAGLERPALAGVDDHPHLGIGVELLPRHRELVAHLRRHRVELVGPVVDEPTDGPAALHDQAVERRVLHRSAFPVLRFEWEPARVAPLDERERVPRSGPGGPTCR